MLTIRLGRSSDVARLTDIYNHYIEHSYATFDEAPFETNERTEWFERFAETGPYRIFVAERDGQVLGCATSSKYREHASFRETVESGIYIAADARGGGIGTSLYSALFSALAKERIHRVVAGIALPNDASVALHLRFGFRQIGVFDEYAQKRGRRISSVWMEKAMDGAF